MTFKVYDLGSKQPYFNSSYVARWYLFFATTALYSEYDFLQLKWIYSSLQSPVLDLCDKVLFFPLGSQEDLMLDLAGGRDDLHCPVDKPIYVSSIAKGSFLEGKLK